MQDMIYTNSFSSANAKIFIVTHGPLFEEFYAVDSTFDPDLFAILVVANGKAVKSNLIDHIIYTDRFLNPFFHDKEWAESEAIYNVYKSMIYLAFDYVGFIHYDYCLYDGFCRDFKTAVDLKQKFISFSSFDFLSDFSQNIILDFCNPNVLQARNGNNCYKYLLSIYNDVYSVNKPLWSLCEQRINLCSAYACTVDIFQDIMKLIDFVVQNKTFDGFDSQKMYRLPGGMCERLVGVFSAFISMTEIELDHQYQYKK